MKKIFLLGLCLMVSTWCYSADKHLYSTADTLELDTCASAWLIKTFIDPQAEFKFFPKGDLIIEGIAFDTPDAELRRTENKSTFENIMNKYNITDETLLKIGKMIHDLEINYWEEASSVEAKILNEKITTITGQKKSLQEVLKETFNVFDELYAPK